MRPQCYIIAGPNGAGKTTFALEFLPRFVRCLNFINPDLIAQGISPLDPSRSMTRAGRLVLEEIRRNVSRREDFAFETTLAGRTYYRQINGMKESGYEIRIFYLWVPNVELALSRIHGRVEAGGHPVPEIDVRRRYKRSLDNLFHMYRQLTSSLYFFDNSGEAPIMIFKEEEGDIEVFDESRYREMLGGAMP
ncbi:MAG: zeta toxin family protein [Deltaproteobacteria bacterium]|nr:zeta toxin family protein [Deltaproteobacteria bacterium]